MVLTVLALVADVPMITKKCVCNERDIKFKNVCIAFENYSFVDYDMLCEYVFEKTPLADARDMLVLSSFVFTACFVILHRDRL